MTRARRLLALLAVLLVPWAASAQTPLHPSVAILQNDARATGDGQAVPVLGYAVAVVQITTTGSPTFTVQFHGATTETVTAPPASSGFSPVVCTPLAGGSDATSATAVGAWRCLISGLTHFRAPLSAFGGTGTVRVVAAVIAGAQVSLGGTSGGGGGGGGTVDQGAGASGANAWPVAITDPSNVVVKPGDVATGSVKVNVVAGGAGGGTAETQVRNAGDTTWVNVGPAAANAKMPSTLYTSGGTEIGTAGSPMRTDPTGTTTQPISGSVSVSGSVSANLNVGSNLVGRVHLRNPGDTQNLGDSSNPVRTDPTGTTTQPISGTISALQSGTWTSIGNAADNSANSSTKSPVIPCRANASAPSWTEGNQVPCSVDLAGNLRVGAHQVSGGVTADYDTGGGTQTATMWGIALPASGGAVAGGTTLNPINVTIPPAGNNLCTQRTILSAASTNATNCNGSNGVVYGVVVTNTNAAARFLKLYNKATAPTCGTDTPKMTIPIPGNTAVGGIATTLTVDGVAFDTGIGLCLTTGIGDSDTGAVAANEITVSLIYKDTP